MVLGHPVPGTAPVWEWFREVPGYTRAMGIPSAEKRAESTTKMKTSLPIHVYFEQLPLVDTRFAS